MLPGLGPSTYEGSASHAACSLVIEGWHVHPRRLSQMKCRLTNTFLTADAMVLHPGLAVVWVYLSGNGNSRLVCCRLIPP